MIKTNVLLAFTILKSAVCHTASTDVQPISAFTVLFEIIFSARVRVLSWYGSHNARLLQSATAPNVPRLPTCQGSQLSTTPNVPRLPTFHDSRRATAQLPSTAQDPDFILIFSGSVTRTFGFTDTNQLFQSTITYIVRQLE